MGIEGRRDGGGEKKFFLWIEGCSAQSDCDFLQILVYLCFSSVMDFAEIPQPANKIGQRKAIISQEQITYASKTTQQMPENFAYRRIQAERS